MRPPDIIFVTVDSLRADRCGFMGYSVNTTPFLSTVAKDGIVFTKFYANSVQTSFTFPVIMSGKPPFAWGKFLGIPPFVETISQYLRTHRNYRTVAFISANPALSSSYGYNMGFDEFTNYADSAPPERRFSSKVLPFFKKRLKHLPILRRLQRAPRTLPDAEALTQEAISFLLANSDRPIFLWIHLMDVHTPYNGYDSFSRLYDPLPNHVLYDAMWKYSTNLVKIWEKIKSIPPEQRSRNKILNITSNSLNSDSLTIVQKIYNSAILTVDKHLEVLHETLSKRNINTFLIITSDHGEAFMEHGYAGHEPIGLHNELVKVPLVILSTRERMGTEIDNPYSQVDLYRIITNLAEGKFDFAKRQVPNVVIELPIGSIAPQFETLNWYTPVPVPNNAYAVVSNEFKFIQYGETDACELYNLRDDPSERDNISHKHPDVVDHMKRVLTLYLRKKIKDFVGYRRTMFGYRLRIHLRSRLNHLKRATS